MDERTNLLSRRSKLPLKSLVPPEQSLVFILQRLETSSQLSDQSIGFGMIHLVSLIGCRR